MTALARQEGGLTASLPPLPPDQTNKRLSSSQRSESALTVRTPLSITKPSTDSNTFRSGDPCSDAVCASADESTAPFTNSSKASSPPRMAWSLLTDRRGSHVRLYAGITIVEAGLDAR